jgi:hypothetical protein
MFCMFFSSVLAFIATSGGPGQRSYYARAPIGVRCSRIG